MAAGTVYLDVDDEITSAAARIRSSESLKVGLVVPYGSRISTSRMNFRLLSREAIVNNRRLSIIAADAATRALAASAGLPVFATVAEYESALAGPPAGVDDGPAIAPMPPVIPPASAPPSDASPPSRPRSKRQARADAASAETQAILFPAAVTAAAATPPPPSAPAPARRRPSGDMARPSASVGGAGRPPVARSIGRFRFGTPAILAVIALILVVAVVGVAGYLLLPAADITVTPRQDAIGPLALTITADPLATAIDTTNDVVPAVPLEIPVDVTDTFTTAGKRVEQTAATGTVTFRNVDFTATNTVPAGSIVSTPNGTKFSTDRTVTVPRAALVGLSIVPSFTSVAVTAVKKGPAGNVEPNTITVIPPGEDPVTLTVRNQQATSGGARNEFPRIDQKDLDAATAALKLKLDDAFQAAIAAGTSAPPGTTPFPETGVLGDGTPTPDPTTLLGQEVETFELGLTASGTVIAVDASPVQTIAQARLLANVGAGYRLVDGSIRIEQGDPVVTSGVVTFPVTATAARVLVVDPDALRATVRGQTVEQAKALLAPFGAVTIATWPSWVSSITGFDSRLTITIGGQADGGNGPGSSAAPSSGTAAPSSGTAAPATSEAP